MSIVCVKDFDLDCLSRTSIHKNRLGGEAVYFLYNDNKKIILQSDKIFCNSGLSDNNILELDLTDSLILNIINNLENELKTHYENDENENKIRSILNDTNLKLKVENNQNSKTIIYSSDKSELESVNEDTHVQCLIQIIGVWFKKKEFGVSLKLLQVKTYEKETQLSGYSFIDDTSDLPDVVPNDF
jgi:hypothetical protein